MVRAKVNPHFWPTTTYRVQYGTAACLEGGDWEAPCVKEEPAAPVALSKEVLDADVATKGVLLGASEALTPDTTYRYRFTARTLFEPGSEEAVEVRGLGGKVGEDGTSASFHTAPPSPPAKIDCPNDAFRGGASAQLPDCRAYEMVSPVEKNNGDVARAHEVVDQASLDGEALTFAALNGFAEPLSAPLVSQYVAQREGDGWSTRSISAPSTSFGLISQEYLRTPFKLFGENLCSGWLLQNSDVPLVGGEVPRGVANLYRAHGLQGGCGPAGYELETTVFPLGFGPGEGEPAGASNYYPTIQGFSADGAVSVFRADAKLGEAKLGEEACDVSSELGPHAKGIYQTYLSREGTPGVPPRLVSVLPGGEAACTHSSVGTPAQAALNNDSLYHAVSSDGSRVYWTATQGAQHLPGTFEAGLEPGKIYLRLNAGEPKSALTTAAEGKGNLAKGSNEVKGLIAAEGKGTLSAGSDEVTSLETTLGRFLVGQPVNPVSGKIPSGTTITEVTPTTLTLSAPATGSGTGVTISSKGPSPFAAGQAISGAGIAAGTTIVAVAAGVLTLSQPATASKAGALLNASVCSEPEAACTLPVSAEAEALSKAGASVYLSAAADGSRAIFMSGSALYTGGNDLYEFDLAKALARRSARHADRPQSAGDHGCQRGRQRSST